MEHVNYLLHEWSASHFDRCCLRSKLLIKVPNKEIESAVILLHQVLWTLELMSLKMLLLLLHSSQYKLKLKSFHKLGKGLAPSTWFPVFLCSKKAPVSAYLIFSMLSLILLKADTFRQRLLSCLGKKPKCLCLAKHNKSSLLNWLFLTICSFSSSLWRG